MRKGSVTVFSLIVMTVILTSSLYLIYITKLQSLVSSSYNYKIQSNYLAENMLNKLLFKDEYYQDMLLPTIVNYLKAPNRNENRSAKIVFKQEDIDELDEGNGIIDIEYFFSNDSKHMMSISCKSICRGIENEVRAYATMVNDLYHYGDGTVVCEANNEEIGLVIEDIGKNINIGDIPASMRGFYFFDRDYINLDYRTYNSNSLKYGGTEQLFQEEIFLIVKDKLYSQTPIHLNIGELKKNPLKLKGIIYLEGDLIISSEFQLNGILIIKGGNIIVNTDKKPLVKGIILTDGNEDYSDLIDVQSNYQDMCKYGCYLPDFIDAKIEVIKKY